MIDRRKSVYLDHNSLPTHFPTHKHSAEFWTELGRAIATFGFLEEILGKAIFALTATRSIPEEKIDIEYSKWVLTLERALYDPLGSLINSYGEAVQKSIDSTPNDTDSLLSDLRDASSIRNVLCHGSWGIPDDKGRSLPLYVDRKLRKFETPVDIAFLAQVQRQTAELACAVISSVTLRGYQFPGSAGPGQPIA